LAFLQLTAQQRIAILLPDFFAESCDAIPRIGNTESTPDPDEISD
jgi:hypothetical protein